MYKSYSNKTSPLKMTLKRASQKQMDENNSAFNESIDHRTFFIRGKQKDPLHLLKNYKERVYLLLKQKLRNTPIKFYITMLVRFINMQRVKGKHIPTFFMDVHKHCCMKLIWMTLILISLEKFMKILIPTSKLDQDLWWILLKS